MKCATNKLTIVGYNVKISDFHLNDCMASASIIEIFAWNKLFIDADINKAGQQAQIALIAPMWEIVGERQIILSGENTPKNFNARVDGKPGLPGGSSGHFIGIGDKFMNDQHLEVVCVGGKGGMGNDGGNHHDVTGIVTICIPSLFSSQS